MHISSTGTSSATHGRSSRYGNARTERGTIAPRIVYQVGSDGTTQSRAELALQSGMQLWSKQPHSSGIGVRVACAAGAASGRTAFRQFHQRFAQFCRGGSVDARGLMANVSRRFRAGAPAGHRSLATGARFRSAPRLNRPPGSSLSSCSASPATSAIGCTGAGRSERSVPIAMHAHRVIAPSAPRAIPLSQPSRNRESRYLPEFVAGTLRVPSAGNRVILLQERTHGPGDRR